MLHSKATRLLRLTLALVPLAAGAQPMTQGSGEGARSSDGSQMMAPVRPAARREVLLAQVQERLVLTPTQQELWRWYENRVEAYVATHQRQRSALPSPEDTATHQVGRMVDNLQNRLAALEQVESATRNLYASLNPEQQRIANQLLIHTIPAFGASPLQNSATEPSRRPLRPDIGSRQRRPGGGLGGTPPPN